jgi:uncharacterized protein YjbI with pentapeptide repeats
MDNTHCNGRYHNGALCRRPVIEGFDWCIFHLPEKEEKHIEDFERLFENEKSSQIRLCPDFLDFTGFNFPSSVIFDTDLPNVCFKGAVFHDYVLFWDINEQKSVSINGNAWFNNSLFMDVVDFSGARFQDAWFNNATFKGLADFSKSVFDKAYFNGVDFKVDSRFSETNFLRYADFREARFRGDGDFSGAHSEGAVSFKDCIFQNAWFTRSRFKKVDFRNAVVLGEIDSSESDIVFEK